MNRLLIFIYYLLLFSFLCSSNLFAKYKSVWQKKENLTNSELNNLITSSSENELKETFQNGLLK
jgi:uncharacterized membrane protein